MIRAMGNRGPSNEELASLLTHYTRPVLPLPLLEGSRGLAQASLAALALLKYKKAMLLADGAVYLPYQVASRLVPAGRAVQGEGEVKRLAQEAFQGLAVLKRRPAWEERQRALESVMAVLEVLPLPGEERRSLSILAVSLEDPGLMAAWVYLDLLALLARREERVPLEGLAILLKGWKRLLEPRRARWEAELYGNIRTNGGV